MHAVEILKTKSESIKCQTIKILDPVKHDDITVTLPRQIRLKDFFTVESILINLISM